MALNYGTQTLDFARDVSFERILHRVETIDKPDALMPSVDRRSGAFSPSSSLSRGNMGGGEPDRRARMSRVLLHGEILGFSISPYGNWTAIKNFLIAKALPLRRAVQHPMKFCRLFLAVPFMILSVWAAPAPSELVLPETLFPQLDSILKQAVQQSPRMLNRALDLEIAENDRIAARTNLLPTVNASYSYNKSKDTTEYLYSSGNNSSQAYTLTKTPYSLTFAQPVFYWGERRNLDQIGAIQLLLAKGQYRDGYRQLVQELRNGYMRLILQKLSARRAKFYLEFAQSQLKQQEDRLLKKEISDAQIFSSRLSAEQAQIALERAEFDYLNARTAYSRLAGMASLDDDAIPSAVPAAGYTPVVLDQLLAGFLSQKEPPSSEAVAIRQKIKIDNLNYANAKTRHLPKISAGIGMTQDQQNNLYGQGLNYSVSSIYAGLTMNWNIFDGFLSGTVLRSTLAHRRQLENDYRQLTERLQQDAQIQVKQINFAARNMAIADRLLDSIQGYLVTVREEFRRGVKSEAEVNQTQLNVYDSEISAGNARSEYLSRVAEFLGTVVNDPVLANITE